MTRGSAIAPPVDDFRAEKDGDGLILRWQEPEGRFEGYILWSGSETDDLRQIQRLPAERTSLPVPPSAPGPLYAIVTYQGSRVSEYAFASPEGERVGEAVTEPSDQGEASPVREPLSTDAPPEEARCLACGGDLDWMEFEEDGRTRRLLECAECGEKHVRSGDGRILMVSQLHYGTCRCAPCDEVHALAKSSDELIICSRTGFIHAWEGEEGEIVLAEPGT
jgi:hypothetical protein